MLEENSFALAREVLAALVAQAATAVTVESCTGGLIAACLTAIPGSSEAVYGGFVTYANQAKERMVGVPGDLIAIHGAVSEPVARAMAEGARIAGQADFAVATTGIAGPGGGSVDKPVGRVHVAVATPVLTVHEMFEFGDLGREAIRSISVHKALELLRAQLQP